MSFTISLFIVNCLCLWTCVCTAFNLTDNYVNERSHYHRGVSSIERIVDNAAQQYINEQLPSESFIYTKARKVRKKSLKDLFFGVLMPSNLPDQRGSRIVLPTLELAVGKVQGPGGLLEGFNITWEYRDTMCSSVYGPLAAFELYTKRKPGYFFQKKI